MAGFSNLLSGFEDQLSYSGYTRPQLDQSRTRLIEAITEAGSTGRMTSSQREAAMAGAGLRELSSILGRNFQGADTAEMDKQGRLIEGLADTRMTASARRRTLRDAAGILGFDDEDDDRDDTTRWERQRSNMMRRRTPQKNPAVNPIFSTPVSSPDYEGARRALRSGRRGGTGGLRLGTVGDSAAGSDYQPYNPWTID